MKTKSVWILTAGIIGGIAISIAWNVWAEHEKREHEQPAKTAAEPSAKAALTLDEAAVRMGGIVAAPLQPVSHRQEIQALGVVLPSLELNDLHNAHAAAKAQAESAQATVEASGKEYARLKALNADDRNVSDKALQTAEALFRSDEAHQRTSAEALLAVEQKARQQWGPRLADAIVNNTSLFRRLATQQDVLVQVTLSGTYLSSQPQTIRLQSPGGGFAEATLISLAPRTDPRFQGQSFFYAAPAQKTGLIPGMNLSAYLPAGPEEQGYLVPEASVVWWQGKAWVYLEENRGQYVKRELPASGSIAGGWFVSEQFADGRPVVVTGAELLLSDELRPTSSSGGEEDND